MEFTEWLASELQTRGIGVRELGRIAGLGSGTVSRIITGSRKPGPEFCQAIARVLRIPEEEIFLRAGLLSSPMSKLFAELSPDQRDMILAEMRRMVEENERIAAKQTFHPATSQL